MTITTAGLGIIVKVAREATANRISYFPPFMICFLILFYCTGVGNGSTFRQVSATGMTATGMSATAYV